MIHAFLASIAQLGDRAIVAVFLQSLLLTVLIFAGLGLGLWLGAEWIAHHWFAAWQWSESLAAVAALLLAIGSAWLLFRAVAIATIGLFADRVVRAVEARHYPEALARGRDVPFLRALGMGLASVGRLIGINLLLSPLYLVLAFTGVGTAIAFFLVNAWLLGRDLGDMVAARHLGRAELASWRRGTRADRFVLGAIGTGLLLVPFVNLVASVLAAAMATHLYHRGRSA